MNRKAIALALIALAIGALASVVALSEIFNDGSVVAIVILVLLAVPALFGVGIWLYAMGFVMTVVSVAEERSAMDTIRRSWWLMMTAPGRTLGLSVVVYIIAMIASSGTCLFIESNTAAELTPDPRASPKRLSFSARQMSHRFFTCAR